MYIDISKLETKTSHIERDCPPESILFDYRGYRLVGPWHIAADCTKNSRDEVTVRATIQGEIEMECDRCLERLQRQIHQPFEVFLLPASRIPEEEEHEIRGEDIDESFYTQPKISLADMLSEQIVLSIPLKVLCDPGCKGICPECGANLNREVCACDSTGTDPRKALLREIRERLKKPDSGD